MSDEIHAPVLTLDGPGGSGKGAVAAAVAAKLNWRQMDSGAIYRVLAWLAAERGVADDDIAGLVGLANNLQLTFDAERVYLHGELVGDAIRTEAVGRRASLIAPLPEVRRALLTWQRAQARPPGLVADGRDMGSVVFPRAGCKIFLTADARARAERRYRQLKEKGFDASIEELFSEIAARDRRDQNRSVSPLKPADDAVVLDTTDMPVNDVIAFVLARVAEAYPDAC